MVVYSQKLNADAAAAAAAAAQIANGKKNDDAIAEADANAKHESMKFLNGQTSIYKSKPDTTRTRHYVGSAN